MTLSFRPALTLASALALVGTISMIPITVSAEASALEQGKKIAFDRKKGNCLSCHQIAGGEMPGNIGPPLIAMKARFPDKEKLKTQIGDATTANPHSVMPPFLKHGIISEAELDKVVEFIHSL